MKTFAWKSDDEHLVHGRLVLIRRRNGERWVGTGAEVTAEAPVTMREELTAIAWKQLHVVLTEENLPKHYFALGKVLGFSKKELLEMLPQLHQPARLTHRRSGSTADAGARRRGPRSKR